MPDPSEATPHSNLMESARAAVAGVNVCLPATVVSYDHDEQRAVVQIVPAFLRKLAGAVVVDGHPAISNVPVVFFGGGGGDYSDTWPLEVGDPGLVVFCDRSIDEWLSTGAAKTEPQDRRRHDVNDAMFIPGHRPFADPVGPLGRDASARVIRAPMLLLGSSSASAFVALASLVDSQLSALSTALSTWVPVANDGGAALKTLITTLQGTGWPASVAATKVKAE